jgi:hypothetical protein
VGWTIAVPDSNAIYLSNVREQLHNSPGFGWQVWVAASQWCVQENFQTLSNKSQVLDKLGRSADAGRTMQSAIAHPSATPILIHQYGRQLLAAKKNKEALSVSERNAERFGGQRRPARNKGAGTCTESPRAGPRCFEPRRHGSVDPKPDQLAGARSRLR